MLFEPMKFDCILLLIGVNYCVYCRYIKSKYENFAAKIYKSKIIKHLLEKCSVSIDKKNIFYMSHEIIFYLLDILLKLVTIFKLRYLGGYCS